MRQLRAILVTLVAIVPGAGVAADSQQYAADGRLNVPRDYREWVFLTSSLDLDYSDQSREDSGRPSLLDNVFVNPEAYRAYLQSGTWPDKTVLVKENRIAASAGTISRSGKFQTGVANMEIHVKDTARFPGGWAFFSSDGKSPAVRLPMTAACYSCHAEHGAVDTTFVQFYPTLLELAKAKGTLSAGYLADERNR